MARVVHVLRMEQCIRYLEPGMPGSWCLRPRARALSFFWLDKYRILQELHAKIRGIITKQCECEWYYSPVSPIQSHSVCVRSPSK